MTKNIGNEVLTAVEWSKLCAAQNVIMKFSDDQDTQNRCLAFWNAKHLKLKFELEETLDIKNEVPLSVISFRTNKNGNELKMFGLFKIRSNIFSESYI